MQERANRIPVTVLTGFLGSGKTTVLNRLLHDPRLTDTAVIVNEFGEIGLDHLLVESALDQAVLMDNGCLCCSVRGDLADTLADLVRRVEEGALPPFARVMIETTGLADPGPILRTLVTDAATADRFRPAGVVTTVDGINGVATLAAWPEARAQVAMADLVLLTKADRAEASLPAVRAAAGALAPGVERIEVANGNVDPARLAALTRQAATVPVDGGAHDHDHALHHAEVASVSIVIDGPRPFTLFRSWLTWLTALRGPDILRVKGLVAVDGHSGPVLIEGVQHVFFTPLVLGDWPDADHRSRIVVIARNVPAAALRASFALFEQRSAA